VLLLLLLLLQGCMAPCTLNAPAPSGLPRLQLLLPELQCQTIYSWPARQVTWVTRVT
jgi:hypothetical protein